MMQSSDDDGRVAVRIYTELKFESKVKLPPQIPTKNEKRKARREIRTEGDAAYQRYPRKVP